MTTPQRKKIFTLTAFLVTALLCNLSSLAQNISGQITDNEGQPIPYATVFIKELSHGTTTNIDGMFELDLPPGNYHISFRSMGYVPHSREITISETPQNIIVNLEDQLHQIKEVRVLGTGEDPAYPIMRKAKGLASYHQNQIDSYTAEVYLRGTVKFKKVSRIIRNQLKRKDVEVKAGDIFVDETLSLVRFNAPDRYKQEIKSVNSTFPDLVDFSVMEFFGASLYQDNIDILISPLARNAFSHYKYTYEGFDYDGPYTVNKIRVTPRRNSKQLFSGYIYLIEDLWCLHSVDLNFDTPFGSVSVRQVFDEVRPGVWLPVGHNYEFEGGVLGVKGSVKFGGSVKYLNMVLNKRLLAMRHSKTMTTTNPEEIPVDQTGFSETKEERSRRKKVEDILQKEEISTRDMNRLSKLMQKQANTSRKDTSQSLEIIEKTQTEVLSGAAHRDSSYWSRIRPIPLSEDEKLSFEERDSLLHRTAIQKTAPDTLSLFKKPKSVSKVLDPLFFGGSKWNTDTTFRVRYPGLINPKSIGFNAVDSWSIAQELSITKHISEGKHLNINPQVGYAFGRKAIYWQLNSTLAYAPMNRGHLSIRAGDKSTDFNPNYGIDPFLNAIYSLTLKDNYARYFRDNYFKVANRYDIANGLVFHAGYEWHNRKRLENTTNFSFFSTKKDYKPNLPNNSEIADQFLEDQKASIARLKIEYTPRYFYKIKNGRKVMYRTSFPTIWLTYYNGMKGVLNSDADFEYFETGLKQRIKTGPGASITYEARAGWFTNSKHLHFSDFVFANTQPVPVQFKQYRHAFFLPDYYQLGTGDHFFEGHISYKAPYVLLKYLPGFGNTLWRELLWTSYYYKPGYKNYFEVGYSLIEIMFSGSISIFAGWENWENPQVGLGIVLDISD